VHRTERREVGVFLHLWYDAGLCGYYFILALAKNRETTRESQAGAGAGRGASHKTASLVTQLSRYGAAIAYTDLLAAGIFIWILTSHSA